MIDMVCRLFQLSAQNTSRCRYRLPRVLSLQSTGSLALGAPGDAVLSRVKAGYKPAVGHVREVVLVAAIARVRVKNSKIATANLVPVRAPR